MLTKGTCYLSGTRMVIAVLLGRVWVWIFLSIFSRLSLYVRFFFFFLIQWTNEMVIEISRCNTSRYEQVLKGSIWIGQWREEMPLNSWCWELWAWKTNFRMSRGTFFFFFFFIPFSIFMQNKIYSLLYNTTAIKVFNFSQTMIVVI